MGTLALALAVACGSDADPGAPAAAGFAAYTACLAEHGVVLPTGSFGPRESEGPRVGESARPSARPSGSRGPGGFGGGGFGGGGFGSDPDRPPAGVDQATWAKALQACASVRPSAGPSGAPGGGRNNSALTAYRNCLTEHGVTVTGGTDALNTADPTTAAAVKACEPLRPTRPTPTPSSG